MISFVAAGAQLVEPWIVIPVVAGSSPVGRPISSHFLFVSTSQFRQWMMLGSLALVGRPTGLEPARVHDLLVAPFPYRRPERSEGPYSPNT